MKIIISEYESYEMKIPDQISFSDFEKLVGKLNVVVSMIKGPSAKKVSTGGPSTAKQTRLKAVSLIKIYNEDGYESPRLTEALKKHNLDFKKFKAVKPHWINRFGITPEEVGEELVEKEISEIEKSAEVANN